MFKKTKGYATGGGVKSTKYMAKGGAAQNAKPVKGTKYMAKGGKV